MVDGDHGAGRRGHRERRAATAGANVEHASGGRDTRSRQAVRRGVGDLTRNGEHRHRMRPRRLLGLIEDGRRDGPRREVVLPLLGQLQNSRRVSHVLTLSERWHRMPHENRDAFAPTSGDQRLIWTGFDVAASWFRAPEYVTAARQETLAPTSPARGVNFFAV